MAIAPRSGERNGVLAAAAAYLQSVLAAHVAEEMQFVVIGNVRAPVDEVGGDVVFGLVVGSDLVPMFAGGHDSLGEFGIRDSRFKKNGRTALAQGRGKSEFEI